MRVPGLHVVTDDEVLADPGFHERAVRILDSHGPSLALHIRGPGTPAPRLLSVASALGVVARAAGALLLVNDRVDVALAVGADGVQLGSRSLPVAAVRSLCADWGIGASVHSAEEAAAVDVAGGADFLVLGTIWETPSHPARPGAGLELVRETGGRVRAPIVAIGGVTPERAHEALAAGAAGVAVLRGVWNARDPAGAVAEYLDSLAQRTGERA